MVIINQEHLNGKNKNVNFKEIGSISENRDGLYIAKFHCVHLNIDLNSKSSCPINNWFDSIKQI